MITYDKKNVVVLYNNCRLISIQIHSENKIRNLLFFFNAFADFPHMDVVHMQKRELPRIGKAQKKEEEIHSLDILPLGK